MDLGKFATKKNADDGKWFPVKLEGEKVPLAILIYGSDSDVVQEYEKNKIRKLGLSSVKGKNQIDEDTIDELLEAQDEGIVIRIGGVSTYDWKKKTNTDEPIVLLGQTITNDKKSYSFLLENIPALKNFITEKSNERVNFLD